MSLVCNLSNLNSLDKATPTNYQLVFPKIPTESNISANNPFVMNIHSAVIPSLSIGVNEVYWQGNKSRYDLNPIEFDPWLVSFVVDSRLANWALLFKWMSYVNNNWNKIAEYHSKYAVDVSMVVTDNYGNSVMELLFVDVWPSTLGEISFSQREGDVVLESTINFNYDYFYVRSETWPIEFSSSSSSTSSSSQSLRSSSSFSLSTSNSSSSSSISLEPILWESDATYKSTNIDLDITQTIATWNYVNANSTVYVNTPISAGRWYWEIKCTGNATQGTTNHCFGMNRNDPPNLIQQNMGDIVGGWGFGNITSNTFKRDGSTQTPFPNVKFEYLPSGSYYGIAYDADNEFIWLAFNGDWTNTIDYTQGQPSAWNADQWPVHFSRGEWAGENMRFGAASYRGGYEAQIVSRPGEFQGTIPDGFNALALYGQITQSDPPIPTDIVTWSASASLKSEHVKLLPSKDLAAYDYENAYNANFTDLSLNSGKWYYELKCIRGANTDNWNYFGICTDNEIELDDRIGVQSQGSFGNVNTPFMYVDNVNSPSPSLQFNAYTAGDYYGVAVDFDNGYIWLAKNGNWQENIVGGTQGTPGSGDGSPRFGSSNWISNNMRIGIAAYRGDSTVQLVSKAEDFQISSIPSGFSPLADAL